MNQELHTLIQEQLDGFSDKTLQWLGRGVYPDFYDIDLDGESSKVMRISHDDFVASRFRFLIDEEILRLRDEFPGIEVLDEDREVVLLRGDRIPSRAAVASVLDGVWVMLADSLQPYSGSPADEQEG